MKDRGGEMWECNEQNKLTKQKHRRGKTEQTDGPQRGGSLGGMDERRRSDQTEIYTRGTSTQTTAR